MKFRCAAGHHDYEFWCSACIEEHQRIRIGSGRAAKKKKAEEEAAGKVAEPNKKQQAAEDNKPQALRCSGGRKYYQGPANVFDGHDGFVTCPHCRSRHPKGGEHVHTCRSCGKMVVGGWLYG